MYNIFTQSYLYKRLAILWHQFQVRLSPISEINRCYQKHFGRKPNLVEPKDFVEKVYWLQLHTDTTLWSECADKYLMRNYVDGCELGFLLPKNYGHWDDPKLIDFDSLPSQFVLKTNNATETCMIVLDKNQLDTNETVKILKRWLKIRFGYSGYQIHYLRIKPCVLAEELLLADAEQKRISPYSLIDYKIYCCDGEPICIWVAYNRRKESGVDMNIYDTKWISHPEWLRDMPHYTFKNIPIPKPDCLEDVLEYCKVLSKPFPQVRIDFYIISGKPYIGELTFSSGFGFFTEEFYEYLGSKIDLSRVKRIR